MQWYRGTGGLTKEHGVLAGTPSNRHSWRYAPHNDLLAVLVQLAATCLSTDCRVETEGTRLAPFRLTEFLEYLEERFGFSSTVHPTSSQARTIRRRRATIYGRCKAGCGKWAIFRDLSDDFTVQRLTPPYASGHKPTRGATMINKQYDILGRRDPRSL